MNIDKDAQSEFKPSVRASRSDDVPAITAIYAHHVLHGLASFELTQLIRTAIFRHQQQDLPRMEQNLIQ